MGAAQAIMLSHMLIQLTVWLFACSGLWEKGNRVMEIILSSIPAKQHLGKFWGASLVMATQIGIYLILGLAYLWTGVSTLFLAT